MRPDLRTQLEAYYGSVMADQAPIGSAEIADLVDVDRLMAHPTRERSRLPIVVAFATAALVILVVGAPLLLLSVNDVAPPGQEPTTPTTEPTDTTSTAEVTSTTAVVDDEAEPPDGSAVPQGPVPTDAMTTAVGRGTIAWAFVPVTPGEMPPSLSEVDTESGLNVKSNGTGFLVLEERSGPDLVWTSTDGVEWQSSSADLDLDVEAPPLLVGVDGGYLIPANRPDCHEDGVACHGYRSVDGESWEKVELAWDDIHDGAVWYVEDVDEVIGATPPSIGMGGFWPVAVQFDEGIVYFTANDYRQENGGFVSVVEEGDRSPARFRRLETPPFAPQLGLNTACNIAALDGTALAMYPEGEPGSDAERYVLSATTDGVAWMDVAVLPKGAGGRYPQGFSAAPPVRDRCFGQLSSAWLIWGGPDGQLGVMSANARTWHDIRLPDAYLDFSVVEATAAGDVIFVGGSDADQAGYLLGRYTP